MFALACTDLVWLFPCFEKGVTRFRVKLNFSLQKNHKTPPSAATAPAGSERDRIASVYGVSFDDFLFIKKSKKIRILKVFLAKPREINLEWEYNQRGTVG